MLRKVSQLLQEVSNLEEKVRSQDHELQKKHITHQADTQKWEHELAQLRAHNQHALAEQQKQLQQAHAKALQEKERQFGEDKKALQADSQKYIADVSTLITHP